MTHFLFKCHLFDDLRLLREDSLMSVFVFKWVCDLLSYVTWDRVDVFPQLVVINIRVIIAAWNLTCTHTSFPLSISEWLSASQVSLQHARKPFAHVPSLRLPRSRACSKHFPQNLKTSITSWTVKPVLFHPFLYPSHWYCTWNSLNEPVRDLCPPSSLLHRSRSISGCEFIFVYELRFVLHQNFIFLHSRLCIFKIFLSKMVLGMCKYFVGICNLL